jgi:hypothetical protein
MNGTKHNLLFLYREFYFFFVSVEIVAWSMGWNVKECTSTFVSFDNTTDVKKLSNIIRSLWIFKEKGGNIN